VEEWSFVNIFLPALLPVIVLLVLSIFDLGATANSNANPFVAVKDGQLAWAGLGMCINAMYELRHPSEKLTLVKAAIDALFWELICAILILTLIAALGPVFTTSMTVPAASSRPAGFLANCWWFVVRGWRVIMHFKIFFVTVPLTLLSGFLYWKTHLTTQA